MNLDVSNWLSPHFFVEPMCCFQLLTHHNSESRYATMLEMFDQPSVQLLGVPLAALAWFHGNAHQLCMWQILKGHGLLAHQQNLCDLLQLSW